MVVPHLFNNLGDAMILFIEQLLPALSAALSFALLLNIFATIMRGIIKRRLLAMPLSDTDRDIVEHFDDLTLSERGAVIEMLEQKHGKLSR